MKRRLTALAGASALVVLAGCGAMQVRTSDTAAGPLGVTISETRGSSGGGPTPTATRPPLPEGTSLHQFDIEECPIEMSMPVPQFLEPLGADMGGSMFFTTENYDEQDARINVECRLEEQSQPGSVIEYEREYLTQIEEMEIYGERRGSVGGVLYWAYGAETNGEEIIAVDGPADELGIIAVVQEGSRYYEARFRLKASIDQPERVAVMREAFKQIEINGVRFDLPEYRQYD